MAESITTIHLPPGIKKKAQRASKEIFGKINLSGYLQVLIDKDCKLRKIK